VALYSVLSSDWIALVYGSYSVILSGRQQVVIRITVEAKSHARGCQQLATLDRAALNDTVMSVMWRYADACECQPASVNQPSVINRSRQLGPLTLGISRTLMYAFRNSRRIAIAFQAASNTIDAYYCDRQSRGVQCRSVATRLRRAKTADLIDAVVTGFRHTDGEAIRTLYEIASLMKQIIQSLCN